MLTEKEVEKGHSRLLKLADFLETKVPNENFDIHYLVSTKVFGMEIENVWSFLKNGLDTRNCGTTACALGWCLAIFKEFKWDSGEVLKFKNNAVRNPYNDIRLFFGFKEIYKDVHFNGIFSINSYNYYNVMHPTPKDVALKIRKYVVENK